MSVIVEVVCCSVEDCEVATRAGVDRIELCSAIELGGLTPPLGLARTCALVTDRIGLIMMLRPRPGGFCYSEQDIEVMDTEKWVLDDASGFAFGALTENCEIDVPNCKKMVKSMSGSLRKREIVFHRAFDSVENQLVALDTLIDLGSTRVMTSGKAKTAAAGLDTIKRLIDHAAGRIEIMPAGGIRSSNVKEVISTGCTSIHLGPFKEIDNDSQWGPRRVLDEQEVRAVVQIVKSQITSS